MGHKNKQIFSRLYVWDMPEVIISLQDVCEMPAARLQASCSMSVFTESQIEEEGWGQTYLRGFL